MATIKKSKANLSAGPSKMTKRAGPIDPKGKWTKVQERTIGNMKAGGVIKAKNGKSFPDLNHDGKITKADILKGRGVIAKKGASIKKGMHKMPDGSMMKNSMMKMGGKAKKK